MRTASLADHIPKEHWESIKRDLDIEPGVPSRPGLHQATSRKDLVEIDRVLVLDIAPKSQDDASRILDKKGSRLMNYQEAFMLMMENPDLKEPLRGKSFYISGIGTEFEGYHLIDENGNLTPGGGTKWDPTYKVVQVFPGAEPLLIYVTDDIGLAPNHYELISTYVPSATTIIVGIKKPEAL